MVLEEYPDPDEAKDYKFVRPAGKMETIFSLYGELGTQSNIILAATYTLSDTLAGAALDRDTLFPALRQLTDENWALQLVVVERAAMAAKKKGLHEYWEAQLRSIDLDRIVEFTNVDDSKGLDQYIEAQHNTWLDWPGDTSTPFWRLKVLNGRHVLFIYHHAICDGMSGYAFHRRLLKKLNERRTHPMTYKAMAVFEPAAAEPPASWLKTFPAKVSILTLLWDVLFMHLIRFLYKGSIMFDDVPIKSKSPSPLLEQRKSKEKSYCRTIVRSLRIPSSLQSDLLAACKRNNTTLGSLLHVVSVATMATDVYPNAKIALSASPFSARPFTVPVQGPDLMVNSVGSNMRVHRLAAYRAATSTPAKHPGGTFIDPKRTWALSAAYTKHFRRGLSSLSMFNGSLAGAFFTDEIETLYEKFFPNLWLYQRFFTVVSNLGVFATDTTKQGCWEINDVQFSVAAVRSDWGFAAPVFNVASVRGGSCVISCTIEEGLLSTTVIEGILAGMEKRLSLLVAKEE